MSRTPAATRVRCVVATLLLTLAGPARAAAPRNAVVASFTVMVPDPDPAADRIVRWNEERGGYFATWTEDRLELRVLASAVDALSTQVGALGTIVERDYQSDDLGAELAQLEARLTSRREMLGRYRGVLVTANPEAVVAVEKEMVALIGAIEEAQGELSVLRHRAAFARITVRFHFVDTQVPPDTGGSSFPWLDTLNLADFVGGFRDEH